MTYMPPTPPLEFKPDFEEANRRWLAFWNQELIDRPCCVITAPKEGVEPVPGTGYMTEARDDLDETVSRIVARAETVWWGGESIPSHSPSFGPDMMAAWMGAKLEFGDGTGTSWAVPCIDDWEEALPLTLDPDNYWWQRMLEFCRTMAEAFRGKMVVAHLDLHSNMDLLLAMRGGAKLCMDLMDIPETIDRAMADARALYKPVYDGLYEAGNMGETGTLGWVPAYHPVKTNTIQCDYAALIGPEHFRRWVMPALEEETEHLEHTVYHLDGPECLVHVPDLCTIDGLDCIQWTTGARNKSFMEWMDLLKDIQARGTSLWIPCSIDEMKIYQKKLEPNKVFYCTYAATQAEGEAALQWLKDNT